VHHLDRRRKKTCFFRPGAVGLQQNSFDDHSCKLTRALMFSIEPSPTKSEHECNRRAQLRTACSPVDVLNPLRFAPPSAHHAARRAPVRRRRASRRRTRTLPEAWVAPPAWVAPRAAAAPSSTSDISRRSRRRRSVPASTACTNASRNRLHQAAGGRGGEIQTCRRDRYSRSPCDLHHLCMIFTLCGPWL
jgi:hypothetical protein